MYNKKSSDTMIGFADFLVIIIITIVVLACVYGFLSSLVEIDFYKYIKYKGSDHDIKYSDVIDKKGIYKLTFQTNLDYKDILSQSNYVFSDYGDYSHASRGIFARRIPFLVMKKDGNNLKTIDGKMFFDKSVINDLNTFTFAKSEISINVTNKDKLRDFNFYKNILNKDQKEEALLPIRESIYETSLCKPIINMRYDSKKKYYLDAYYKIKKSNGFYNLDINFTPNEDLKKEQIYIEFIYAGKEHINTTIYKKKDENIYYNFNTGIKKEILKAANNSVCIFNNNNVLSMKFENLEDLFDFIDYINNVMVNDLNNVLLKISSV